MSNRTSNIWVACAVLVFGLTVTSHTQAGLLDLTNGGTLSGNQGSQVVLPDATIDLITGDFLIIGDFDSNAVCALTQGQGCVGSFSLTWNVDVSNVTFDYGFADPGDSAAVSLFDALDNFLGSVTLSATSGIANEDLSGFGSLRKIEFDTTASTGAGYSFGLINFDVADAAVVPSPSVLTLFSLGLAGLAWRRRRTV